MENFNFQFMSNQLNKPLMVALPATMFEAVDVKDVKTASFSTVKYQENKCYDNVVKTLLKHMGDNPNLLFCIGLHQLVDKPEQIVEHCWFEENGQYYDFTSELPKARHYKYVSFSLEELLMVMDSLRTETVPNIIEFYAWAQHQAKAN